MATATIKLSRDDLTPAFARLGKMGADPTPVLRSMGTVFKSITEGNFSSAGAQYRPQPWRAKKDGTPRTLKKSGLLWHSFHLTVTKDTASLANPTPYAAVHQFGSDKKSGRGSGIPASPFYPVLNNHLTPAAEKLIAAAALRAIQRIADGK